MKVTRPTTPSVSSPSAEPAKPRAAEAPAAAPAGWQPRAKPARTATSSGQALPSLSASPTASAFGGPGLDAGLDKATNSRAVPGNKLTMLFDGVNSFAERNRLIDGAKESISLQTFIFNSDDTGWELANRLSAAAKRGVEVRVIYDGMGSNRADPKMFEMMKAAGVQVREYADPKDKPLDLNARWHEKHLVIDGRTSIEGGMNIANEYALGGSGKMVYSRGKTATEPWRDADVKLEGPAVQDTAKAFLKNWAEVGPGVTDAERAKLLPKLDAVPGGSDVRVVQHHPADEKDSNTVNLYRKAIDSAQKSITIENAYFLPPKELRDALVRASARGVQVQVMTNSRASNDMGVVSDASRYFYDDLMKAGVKIYEKQGGTLHAKTATFDGEFSLVGSANLNGRSDGRDSEVVLAIRDRAVATQLTDRFSTGTAQTKQVTQEELANESFLTNLKQWAMSTLAWTF
jgi:cardiolipin synthase